MARRPKPEAIVAKPQWHDGEVAVGQRRLLDPGARGDVRDDDPYTAHGCSGGGGAGTTWLVGSTEEVAASLRRYRDIGITHVILSDTPYLHEIERRVGSRSRSCPGTTRDDRPPNDE